MRSPKYCCFLYCFVFLFIVLQQFTLTHAGMCSTYLHRFFLYLQINGAETNNATDVTSSESWGSEMDESLLISAFIIVVCGSVLVVHFVIVNKLSYLPESVAVVIYGIIVGIVLHFINVPVARHLRTFDTEAFFLFILPCIIFETGFSLPKVPISITQ
jgi:hypothetical protein